MVQKVPILLVGGDERNIPKGLDDRLDITHVHVDAKSISPQTAMSAVAIVVLRWVSGPLWEKARDIATKRRVPIMRARTGNYILDSMRQYKSLAKLLDDQDIGSNGNGHPKGKSPETEPATEEVATETKTSGLSLEDLQNKYLAKLKGLVKSALKPGERIDGGTLCDLLSGDDYVGLPAEDIAKLLPILDQHSILCNEVGNTWVLIWSPDGSYVHEATYEEVAPKKEEPPEEKPLTRMEQFLLKIPGLPEGPYDSVYQITKELEKYTEFSTLEGTPISNAYASRIAQTAITDKFIVMKGLKYHVEHDDSVKLTLREQPKPKPGTLGGLMGKLLTEGGDKDGKKETFTDSELRKILVPAPTVGLLPGQIDVVRSLFPEKHWLDSAMNAIYKRLDRKGYKREPIDPKLLSKEEWDAYAWETIKKFTMEMVGPVITDSMRDEPCICFDCKRTFVFTKGQKQFLIEKFGEYKTPRRCPQCKDRQRQEGDDYDPRVPLYNV